MTNTMTDCILRCDSLYKRSLIRREIVEDTLGPSDRIQHQKKKPMLNLLSFIIDSIYTVHSYGEYNKFKILLRIIISLGREFHI